MDFQALRNFNVSVNPEVLTVFQKPENMDFIQIAAKVTAMYIFCNKFLLRTLFLLQKGCFNFREQQNML